MDSPNLTQTRAVVIRLVDGVDVISLHSNGLSLLFWVQLHWKSEEENVTRK